ncbi:MAG: thermonuclease family protein [Pyrinomonadaceae bacterium]
MNEVLTSQANDTIQVLRIRQKSAAKRVLVLAGITFAVAISVLYLGGFLRASENESAPDTPLPLTQKAQSELPPPETTETKVLSDDRSYKVSKVFTGDIIEVVDESNQEYRINIFGIRAPKLNENFGAESKQNLSNLVLGKTVFVRTKRTDGTDGVVAEVICGNSNAGVVQIQAGLVWMLNNELGTLGSNLGRQYLDAESSAKQKKYGLWSGSLEPGAESEVSAVTNPPSTASADVYARGIADQPVELFPIAPVVKQVEGIRNVEPKPSPARVSETPKPAPLASGPTQSEVRPVTSQRNVEPTRTPKPDAVKTESPGPAYVRGPRGGCFYINSKGSKVYVDRSICN